jgi:hypothetical protein
VVITQRGTVTVTANCTSTDPLRRSYDRRHRRPG